jgi:uncharacterized hydrophobic protein (TIGR00271 family)
MPEKNRIFNPSVVEHELVIDRLVVGSSPRKVFLMMITISSIIAALGLLNDSATIVIGAMLVAPLLWPVLGISMGLIVRDWRMIRLSMLSILVSALLAVVTAIVITFFYIPLGASNEILQDTSLGFMFPVALAAGAAAAFAMSYESVKEAVPGVAISVALLPPLVAIGIGLGGSNWALMWQAVALFGMNLVGIIIVSLLIFLLLGFGHFRSTAKLATQKEEKVLQSK